MKARTYYSVKRGLIIAVVCIAVIVVFAVSFVNDNNFPTWDDIYRLVGLSPEQSYDDYIRFLDVGQGDSILISSNGYNALIDTGRSETAQELSYELKKVGVDKIDLMILTHHHDDHIGGVEELFSDYRVENLIMPQPNKKLDGYDILKSAKNNVLDLGGKVYTATEGMNVDIGDFEITVLCYYSDMSDENNRSIVTMAKIKDYKFLLTGDAQASTEIKLLENGINVDCDVLKLGHHGSKTSTCDDFLSETTPRYAVISVGEGNSYGHPHSSVIDSLEDEEVDILRTDESGNITFYLYEDFLKYDIEYKK